MASRLVAEDLHDVVARVHLLDVPVERPRPLPLGGELLLRALGDEHRDHDRDRHDEQRDDGQQRADPEHHDQDADDREDRRDDLGEALLERLRDVVDVVRHAAEDVAAGVVVEVLERQPGELEVDVPAQSVDGPLRDTGHDVALTPAEDGAQQVDDRHHEQHLAEGGEIDARPRRHGHAREHVGELVLARRPEPVDGLLLGDAGGNLLADDSLEDDVGRVAQDLGPGDAERDADDGEGITSTIRPASGSQLATRRFSEPRKSFGFSAGAMPMWPGGPKPLRDPVRGGPAAAPGGAAHATSSSVSCE